MSASHLVLSVPSPSPSAYALSPPALVCVGTQAGVVSPVGWLVWDTKGGGPRGDSPEGVSPGLFSAPGLVRAVHPGVARHQHVETELLQGCWAALRAWPAQADLVPAPWEGQAGRPRMQFHTGSLF